MGHCLKLGVLTHTKAVQPLRQIVQLVHIGQRTIQGAQHTVMAVHFIHRAVPVHGVPQIHRLEHLNRLIVLISGDGEGNGDLPAFRVPGIGQHRLDHIAHTISSPTVCLGTGSFAGWLRAVFRWGPFCRGRGREGEGGLLDGSIIIRSRPSSRVSPMKYRAIIFCSFLCLRFPKGAN